MLKIALESLGCSKNLVDAEIMMGILNKKGYKLVGDFEEADIILVNTCGFIESAKQESIQTILELAQLKETANLKLLIVTGCLAQRYAEELKTEIPEIDAIVGTGSYQQIDEIIANLEKENHIVSLNDIDFAYNEDLPRYVSTPDYMAYLKIGEGCDNKCTYCIIPYARGGKVRSRDLESIVSEVEKLVLNGYKEVVLTGIHVASYGKDVRDENINLLTVIKAINEINGIERIRLSSVEPVLFTDEFVNEVSKMEKVCPHYHLSLQSGCDETLKRMNRRYTTKEYKEIVDRLRENIPNVAITTDVIVGFPGETNDEFNKTYEFLKEIELSQMHVFKYSPRKGTPAATMENQIDPQMKQFRSEKLLNLNKENFNKFAGKFIGQEIDVLFEQSIAENTYEGLTPNYIRVIVKSDREIHGEILKVKLTDIKDEYVEGTLV